MQHETGWNKVPAGGKWVCERQNQQAIKSVYGGDTVNWSPVGYCLRQSCLRDENVASEGRAACSCSSLFS
jgi:hypothetical protein